MVADREIEQLIGIRATPGATSRGWLRIVLAEQANRLRVQAARLPPDKRRSRRLHR